ncbi:MAG: response regulator [Bacteroidales bacterium]|nr:response regulator [Bacteroidales bacterium]
MQSSNSLSHNQVKDIELIGEKLYIATYGDGINIYDVYKNQFTNHLNNKQLSDILYAPLFGNQIYRDVQNRIWVASIRGLYLIDDNKVKTFVYSPSDSASINSNHVVTIYQDKKKQIWIGTKKGLNLYDEVSGKFLNMNQMSRLPEDVKAILEDKKGNLWISSNIGITKFNPVSLETVQFTEADGLQANEFHERSCLLTKSGKMYFGGINGFSAFFPEDIEVSNTESVPYLTELRVLNQIIKPNDKTGILNKNIMFCDEITLPYNKSTFTIEFSSIDESHAQRLKYAYKMENLDKSWTYVEDNNKAYFTNLDPGVYYFKVKAASGSLKNSNQIRMLKVTITPPIWAQFWFKVFAFVIITLAVFYYVQRKIWRLEKMKKELAKDVRERTFEIELQKDQLEDLADKLQFQNLTLREHQEQLQETFSELKIQSDELKIANSELKKINETKNKLFSLIAHDLKGPIGSIKSFSSLLVSDYKDLDDDEIVDYLEIIQDSSHASVEMFENLLEWARSQTETVQFKPEAVNLKEIISNVIEFQNLTASNKSIQIVDRVGKNIWFYADKNMLLTILRNLISNSIKFTNEGGAITIQSDETDTEILISVKDTGIGMTDKRINSILNKEDQHSSLGTEGEKGVGLGLTICKEFLQIHGGKILIESELGMGTTIIAVLPNKKVESKDFVTFPDAVESNDIDLQQNASILKDKLLLIIDDNANSRHAIKHSLKNKCEIIEAKNGLQGIELAKEKMPDCIISDIIMPEKTGIELCRELKADKFTNFIPIILLTSSKEEIHKRDAYTAGADEFITKPFNPEMLESRIINLLIKQENIKKMIRESISLEEESLNSTINNEFLQKVHDIANLHINDSEFSIEFLASQLGYSRYQFFRKFKAIVGQTPVEYILNYRLQKAEILLRKGKLRVSEIAYETGFSNPKYFATTFRKKYGMTPSEYMEKRQMAGLS